MSLEKKKKKWRKCIVNWVCRWNGFVDFLSVRKQRASGMIQISGSSLSVATWMKLLGSGKGREGTKKTNVSIKTRITNYFENKDKGKVEI